jgi:multifunctional methyltransferase subunit TRM112
MSVSTRAVSRTERSSRAKPHRLTLLENCTKDNFPLVFENVELEVRPAEANLDFIKRFIPKLEWDALVQTARSIGEDSLPERMPEDKATLESEEFLQKLHHVLMEVSGRWTSHI